MDACTEFSIGLLSKRDAKNSLVLSDSRHRHHLGCDAAKQSQHRDQFVMASTDDAPFNVAAGQYRDWVFVRIDDHSFDAP